MAHWLDREEYDYKPEYPEDLQFSIDRGRLSNSAAFRRLQGKTQVMGAGEHDFFRTRLTHSIEVANIGITLTRYLNSKAARARKDELTNLLPNEALMQTICFAHDIGHPAFGHVGEKILNYHMYEHGGFEGNGQTLRILARLGEYYKDHGYKMTRRTLLGVIKYPILFKDAKANMSAEKYCLNGMTNSGKELTMLHASTPNNLKDWKPPKCLHDDEEDLFNWILEPLSNSDKASFLERKANGKTKHKSLDCSIMELADDISYALHDLEDVISMGLVNRYEVVEQLKDELVALSKKTQRGEEDTFIELIQAGDPRSVKQAITQMVNVVAKEVEYTELTEFEEPLLKYRANLPESMRDIVESIKTFVLKQVILSPNLQTLEFKGQKIINDVFEAVIDNYKLLLPTDLYARVKAGAPLHRTVCDYLASMTDREAGLMYERLFMPTAGSVFQPI